jgi:hypothetical protein
MEAMLLARRRDAVSRLFVHLLCLGLLVVLSSGEVRAQPLPFVTPGANTNIIGITPDPANVPDFGLKQQQEPSCVVRPSNPSYIFCAYNDLRASDLPTVQGDSWMGVSMSADEGKTWFSRLAPGYLGDGGDSLGMGFAADPSLVAIPGNSPGLAILNFIAADRDSDDGILAIQRWVEFAQEDTNFWKPEAGGGRVVSDGSEGRFIDKPAFAYIIDPEVQQGTIQQTITVEGGEQVPVTTPTGYLVVAYAVFTGGGGGSKVYVKWSQDNGLTWIGTKISEGQNEVTGVSIASIGSDYVVTYRRKADSNDTDAIVSVQCTLSGNKKCAKANVVFEMCPFDQWATATTFRTFAFPWAASNGERYWVFAADRRFAGDASCTPVPDAPGLYSGKPRIVGMSSVNGKDWVGDDDANPDVPFVVAPRSDSDADGDEDGMQVMPAAFGTKGRIDVAWYETIREEQQGLPPGNNELLINDYSSGPTARVLRKADVWMTRLIASCGNSPSAACAPTIEEPVRVSQYPFVFDNTTAVGQETEAHLPNLQLYASGTLAFKGDYIALATPPFRRLANGTWIPNNVPAGHLGVEAPGYTDAQNLFIAWGDNRDVKADFTAPQLIYTPPSNSGIMVRRDESEPGEGVDYERPGTLVAEDEPDDSPDPAVLSDLGLCSPNIPGGAPTDFSQSRNSNVYGSLVRDEPTLVAPTPTKPLGTIQRMFPLELTNPDANNPADFCLVIPGISQPLDYEIGTGLASFYQLPAIAPFNPGDEVAELPVRVPAASSASRAVFVTTTRGDSVITVNAYEDATDPGDPDALPCDVLGTLVNSVQLSDGNLFDPLYCQNNACDPVGNVAGANETHDLTLVSPGLQAPVLQAPSFQAPGFQAPVLQAPSLQAPGFQAPGFQAPGLQAPVLQAPSLQAPGFQAPVLQAPSLQAPSLQAPSLQAAALSDIVVQDTTYVLSADGNVTTTYSTDIGVFGLDPDEIEVQLIAWTPNIYATSVDCMAMPQADNQVIASKQLDAPSLQAVSLPNTFTAADQDPYQGELSFTGTPDKDIAITVRIWATGTAKTTLEQISGEFDPVYAAACDADPDCDGSQLGTRQLIAFGASAQGCATSDAEDNTEIPGLPDCLNAGNEKIFQDRFPPTLTLPGDLTAEATSAAGATVDYAVTATDDTDPDPAIECIPASGSEFPLGLNTVSCSATDESGNSDIGSFEVTVVDTTAPTITAPGPVTVEAKARDTLAVDVPLGSPETDDAVGVTSISNNAPATYPVFPQNETTVTWEVEDAAGNTATADQLVTIVDTTPPTVVAPAAISFEATEVCTPANLIPLDPYNIAAATDLVGIASFTNDAPACYNVGPTDVEWKATDLLDNVAVATQVVTITDTTPPVFNVPNDTTFDFEATSPAGAYVDLTGLVTATDKGEELPVTCTTSTGIELPAYLAADTYNVTCSATDDDSSITVEVVINVDVEDLEAPVLDIPDATLTVGMDDLDAGTATVDFLAPDAFGPGQSITAADNVDTDVAIVCDPANGSVFSEGTTVVTCTASDDGPNASGGVNSVQASFEVNVVFPWTIEIELPKGKLKGGSTLPVDFRYLLGNTVVDSSAISPSVSWAGPFGANCSGAPGDLAGEDSGRSGFRYSASSDTWQYSWQTPNVTESAWFVFTVAPPGTPLPSPASKCVNLK